MPKSAIHYQPVEVQTTQDVESEAAWKELFKAPLQLTLGSLLKLVPNFHKGLLKQGILQGMDVSVGSAEPDNTPPLPLERVTDTRIPELSVKHHGVFVDKVLLDGGAGVNIITKEACERYGLKGWEPTPFLIRMVDQRRV